MIIVFLLIGVIVTQKIIIAVYNRKWDKGLSGLVSFNDDHISEGETGSVIEEAVNMKALPLPVVSFNFELDNSIVYG